MNQEQDKRPDVVTIHRDTLRQFSLLDRAFALVLVDEGKLRILD